MTPEADRENVMVRPVVELPPGLETIMGYYDLDAVGAVFLENGFTQREHFTRLINLCKSVNEKVALAALREVRAARREIIELNGLVGVLKQEELSSDGRLKRQAITQQIMHIDGIIANMTQRRIENADGTAGPSPRIMQPEDRGRTHDSAIPERHTTGGSEEDVGDGQQESDRDVASGDAAGDGRLHAGAEVVGCGQDDPRESE